MYSLQVNYFYSNTFLFISKYIFYETIFFPLVLLIPLLFTNCSKIRPPSSNMGEVDLRLGSGAYLGFCGVLFENQETNLEIEVFVDGIDGQGNVIQLDAQYFNATTDLTDPDNFEFTIEIPESGTFAVSVNVRAESCLDCCTTVHEPNLGCGSFDPGKPRFRGVSITLNASDIIPFVSVDPVIFACGCNC